MRLLIVVGIALVETPLSALNRSPPLSLSPNQSFYTPCTRCRNLPGDREANSRDELCFYAPHRARAARERRFSHPRLRALRRAAGRQRCLPLLLLPLCLPPPLGRSCSFCNRRRNLPGLREITSNFHRLDARPRFARRGDVGGFRLGERNGQSRLDALRKNVRQRRLHVPFLRCFLRLHFRVYTPRVLQRDDLRLKRFAELPGVLIRDDAQRRWHSSSWTLRRALAESRRARDTP